MIKGCSIYHGFNLNKELLKLYSTNLSQDDLLELKRILARYFAQPFYGKPL